MRRQRRHNRCLDRSAVRRAVRSAVRQRWNGPDDLADAIRCFRQAIRSHRRLNRLAPHEFDAAVVDRDRRQREERQARTAEIEAALDIAYGPRTAAEQEKLGEAELLANQRPPLPPRMRRAVDREENLWHQWMASGRLAFDRHKRRRPHQVFSLGRAVTLITLAMDFGSLANGDDWRHPAPTPPPPPPPPDFEADLRRAYGHRLAEQIETPAGSVPPTVVLPPESTPK